MAGLLPMSIERILEVNNLPGNMKVNTSWNDMHKMAIREFEQYVEAEYWGELFTGSDTFDAEELLAGELAVGIFTYVKMMPFLNLNSSPTGFVKKRGIEENAAEIMSFSELKQYKVDMEKQALRTIQKHLTNIGFERLNKLNGKRRNLRCALISAQSNDTDWEI